MNQKNASIPKISIQRMAEIMRLSTASIHKKLKQKGVEAKRSGNKLYLTHNESRSFFNFQLKKQKICVQIVKGGVGKTTCLNNIAAGASTIGARVLIFDIDPHGNATDSWGINADEFPALIDFIEEQAEPRDGIVNVSPGIDLIPSRIENVVLDGKLSNMGYPLNTLFNNILEEIEENYDLILIDCPPTLGHIVTAASLYADWVLVPLNPDKYSAKGLKIVRKELKNIEKKFRKNITYKVFLNKFNPNTILSDKAISTLLSDKNLEGHIMNATIRLSQEIPNITDDDRTLYSNIKKSTARKDFDDLIEEILF